ncbi:hypothetical protein PSACC_01717 [Paramicrosporidium saccamoebae]|uniref:Uncharacterized protein n=1 Tax=Paramicrosporidium saccamoebae TaxID=1246581 RepID=A0A2H9TL51_9FUNG|nr:hypothetical protein PSACC_01717 [Paramicrosporidium saccamoebae]
MMLRLFRSFSTSRPVDAVQRLYLGNLYRLTGRFDQVETTSNVDSVSEEGVGRDLSGVSKESVDRDLSGVNKESTEKEGMYKESVDSPATSTMTNAEMAKVIESTLGPTQILAKPIVKGRKKKAAK